MPYKIAVSGSVGVGKSTLVAALAARLELPVIEEGFEPLFDQGEALRDNPTRQAAVFEQLLREKSSLEDTAGYFVADRCAIDLMHNWLRLGLDRHHQDEGEFIRACRQRYALYDYIVLPPWNVLPLKQLGDDRGAMRRNTNVMAQLRHHAHIVGFTHMFVGRRKIIDLPPTLTDIDARVNFVIAVMRRRQQEISVQSD